jgi:hypothetical protein
VLDDYQIQIISLLKNQNGWLTSNEIAFYLQKEAKFVQLKIADIQDIYGDECIIDVNSHRGYRLVQYSNRFRVDEIEAKIINQEVSRYNPRFSQFLFYLLFQKDYVSLQDISDRFSLSKTAVFSDKNHVMDYLERNHFGAEIVTNNRNGIYLKGSEKAKRMVGSIYMAGVENSPAFAEDPIIKEYKKCISCVRPIIRKILSDNHIFHSEENMQRLSRYIAFSILRTMYGFSLESEESPHISQVMKKLIQALKEKDLYLKDAEVGCIQTLIYINEYHELSKYQNSYTQQIVKDFECFVSKLLKRPFMVVEPESFKREIVRIQEFHKNHYLISNSYSMETFVSAPLEVFIISRYFNHENQFDLSYAEISVLANLLAVSLYPCRKKIKAVLLLDQNWEIAEHLKQMFDVEFGNRCNPVDIVYDNSSKNAEMDKYDIVLTTNTREFFMRPHWILVPPVIKSAQKVFYNNNISQRINEIYDEKLEKLRQDIVHYETVVPSDSFRSVDAVLKSRKKDADIFQLNKHSLCFCVQHSKTGKPQIIRYKIKGTLSSTHNHSVNTIVYVKVTEKIEDIFLFFDLVCNIINE